jgi:anti-anti-sigma regulatory factor
MKKLHTAESSSVDFVIDDTGATGVLKIRGALTESQVENVRQTLEDSQPQINHYKLNFENVTAVDLTSIQALYLTCKTLKRSNKTLAIDGICPVTFTSAVENMGLSNQKWLCFGQCDELLSGYAY